jgi:hypothetical protein
MPANDPKQTLQLGPLAAWSFALLPVKSAMMIGLTPLPDVFFALGVNRSAAITSSPPFL